MILKHITKFVLLGLVSAAACMAAVVPDQLRCEYRDNPLGIDAEHPRLQWKLVAGKEERGIRQTAYQIQVATSEKMLESGKADLWDSGKVASDQSIQIAYAGKPLTTGMRCHWNVRVWDQSGKQSDWSKPALWTMGLLAPDDWTAQWIGYDAALQVTPEQQKDDRIFNIGGLQWVRIADSNGKPSVKTGFRKQLDLPADRTLRRAVWVLYAFHHGEAFVNGSPVGMAAHWEPTSRLDVTRSLRPVGKTSESGFTIRPMTSRRSSRRARIRSARFWVTVGMRATWRIWQSAMSMVATRGCWRS